MGNVGERRREVLGAIVVWQRRGQKFPVQCPVRAPCRPCQATVRSPGSLDIHPVLTVNYAAAQVDGPELLYIKFSINCTNRVISPALKVKATRRN